MKSKFTMDEFISIMNQNNCNVEKVAKDHGFTRAGIYDMKTRWGLKISTKRVIYKA